MIHGKTDRKPFKKLSYCEFDCNWESDQNEMNVWEEFKRLGKSLKDLRRDQKIWEKFEKYWKDLNDLGKV